MSENVSRAVDIQQHFNTRFDAQDAKLTANFNALMAGIADLKAQYKHHWQLISALSERVAVLESRHQ